MTYPASFTLSYSVYSHFAIVNSHFVNSHLVNFPLRQFPLSQFPFGQCQEMTKLYGAPGCDETAVNRLKHEKRLTSGESGLEEPVKRTSF